MKDCNVRESFYSILFFMEEVGRWEKMYTDLVIWYKRYRKEILGIKYCLFRGDGWGRGGEN